MTPVESLFGCWWYHQASSTAISVVERKWPRGLVQFASQVDYVDQGLADNETVKNCMEVNRDEWLKTPTEIESVQDEQDKWSMVCGSAGHKRWVKAASKQEPKVSMGSSSQSYYFILQEEQEEEEVSMQDDDGTEESQDYALTSFDLTYSGKDNQECKGEASGEEAGAFFE
jgi:hypothetical protein